MDFFCVAPKIRADGQESTHGPLSIRAGGAFSIVRICATGRCALAFSSF